MPTMTSKGEVSPNLDATLAATWRNHLWKKRCVLNLSLLRENKPQKFELFFPLFPAEPYFQDLNVHPFASVYLSFKNFPSKVWGETNTFVFKKVPILTPSRDAILPSYIGITLPKTNIAPEKLPSQKESSLQTISFQWFWLFVFRKIPTSADLPLRSPGKRWRYLCERWTSQQHGRKWRNSSAKKRGRPGDSLIQWKKTCKIEIFTKQLVFVAWKFTTKSWKHLNITFLKCVFRLQRLRQD